MHITWNMLFNIDYMQEIEYSTYPKSFFYLIIVS